MKNKLKFVTAFLLFSTLACKTVMGGALSTPTQLTYKTSLTVTVVSADVTRSPENTETQLPPTPITPVPTVTDLQWRIFQELWTTIRDDYLYPDYNGVDWQAVYDEYTEKLEAGLTEEQFYIAMDEMVALLNDDHSGYLSPEEVAEEDAEYAGQNNYVGIGILSSSVVERQRATIIVVFPGSPAEEAGIKSHDNILFVDGEPILDEFGLRSDLLRGPEGTTITVTVQTPGELPRDLQITRRRILGALPVPFEVMETSQGKRIGYILVPSFADETVDDQVGKALAKMTESQSLDGIILDNRQNSGGADTVATGVFSYFTHGKLGYFASRNNEQRWLSVTGKDVGGSSRLPLVVLIGPATASFGEIFAGVLKDKNRAFLIGETTEGNVELLWSYEFDDGSRAWIAREAFHPQNNPSQDWEKDGIIPDLAISSNWDEVTLQTDPAILAALDHFDDNE